MNNSGLSRALQHGFLDQAVPAPGRLIPQLIDNQAHTTMSRAISTELREAHSFVFSVAFVTPAAVTALKQDLLDFRGKGQVITSNYLGFNEPRAYRELLNIPNLEVWAVPADRGFHAKGYVFRRECTTTAIVGSSNLTVSALSRNHEWNLRFTAANDGHIIAQLEDALEAQRCIAERVDQAWIERFEANYVRPVRRVLFDHVAGFPPVPDRDADTQHEPILLTPREHVQRPPERVITPNRMQSSALASLQQLRQESADRALVISATGTGKTMLSALDVRQAKPKRFLFLAHREQILDKALLEYRSVLGGDRSQYGKLSGTRRDLGAHVKYLFATTQSFVRLIRSGDVAPDEFDYIVIDEVHRAGADTYLEILDYVSPAFLLGMTATPERTDGFNVFQLFHYNLAYEIRLQEALEADMLAPFHYFGVTDFTDAAGNTIDETSELRYLASSERADHLVAKLEQYGQAGVPPRGLIFCSRNREAEEMSVLLNQRKLHGYPLRTLAISGSDSIETREDAVRRLEAGELDYLLSVDIFNEGIDIPSLNQIVMMRQTQSSVVFTQQLGRGLRKHADKDYLVVIDFIGNYANNYLIPTALFGDTSLNKDQLRRRLIDVRGDHVIAGISSINFDQIATDRIFAALGRATLDSLSNLKRAYTALKGRLGREPLLLDFAKHDALDPYVVATKFGNYAEFLERVEGTPVALDGNARQLLTFLSMELLNVIRPQELLLLDELVRCAGPVTADAYRHLLNQKGLDYSEATLTSVRRIFSLEWFTKAERRKYGDAPLITFDGRCFHLSERWRAAWDSAVFRRFATDALITGLYLAEQRHQFADQLIIGNRYTRKDVCRILNWQRNEQSTMYGYKVDRDSGTCPIFVTYHKAEDVSESTRYEDEFLDQQTMLWFTRSNRTVQSREVKAIIEQEVPLFLFVKKDDAEGTDFIYLGQVTPSNVKQTEMPNDKGTLLPVVTMHLTLPRPVDSATFDYFVGPSFSASVTTQPASKPVAQSQPRLLGD